MMSQSEKRYLDLSVFFASYRFVRRLKFLPERVYQAIKAVHDGLWLALLPHRKGYLLTERWYSSANQYHDEEFNLKGLYGEEEQMVEKYFRDNQTILVGGAGGGREMLALFQRNFDVVGFECNEILRSYGNNLLHQNGFEPSISHAESNHSIASTALYEGILIGWGVYIHIISSESRIAFLRELQGQLKEQGCVILGYCYRSPASSYFTLEFGIAAPLRRLIHNEIIEKGDKLEPTLEHHFTVEEISSEAAEAGFDVVDETHDTPGRALIVLRAADHP